MSPTHQPESADQQVAQIPCSAAAAKHLSSPDEAGTQLPQAACGSQDGKRHTQAAECLEGSARQLPSSNAGAEAQLPQAARGCHTDLHARPAATLPGAASGQAHGPQQSLIRHVTLRDCLGTWQTDSPRLQATHNSGRCAMKASCTPQMLQAVALHSLWACSGPVGAGHAAATCMHQQLHN